MSSSGFDGLAVVLPVWQPTPALLPLANALRESGFGLVLAVDDGSGVHAQASFTALEQRGIRVLRHERNRGKGRALKTAFHAIAGNYPHVQGVITADADGQHTPDDIVRVAQQLQTSLASSHPRPVLGTRCFGAGVPFRSRFGNRLTRLLFPLVVIERLADTQSGLRGFPVALLPELLQVEGERYEFEIAVLAHLCLRGQRPVELPIKTVYLEENRGSHFRPLRDSARVYAVLTRLVFRKMLARLRGRYRAG